METQKKKLNYKNGSLHGACKEFYENGTLKEEAVYKRDKLHGISKSYSDSGTLIKTVRYRNGVALSDEMNIEIIDYLKSLSESERNIILSEAGGIHTSFSTENVKEYIDLKEKNTFDSSEVDIFIFPK